MESVKTFLIKAVVGGVKIVFAAGGMLIKEVGKLIGSWFDKDMPNALNAATKGASAAQAIKKIRINEFSGTKLGKLIITETQKGDTWEVVLNNNHAMYEEFIKVISSKK